MPKPIDSRQLRAFASLAKTGSFTRTARELHLSQSAISHAMKALEEELRCRLLDRTGKKVTLTQAGEQLLVRVRRILQEMQEARSDLQQLGRWGHGRLRFSASQTACQFILPGVLREFRESFPNCTIQIEPGDTPTAIELLRNRRVDLALTMETKGEEQFEFHPLFSDELSFILSPMHPWAQRGGVVREEIVRQNYIFYTKTSVMFHLIEDYFDEDGLLLPTFIELGSIEAIKELVKLGIGITILAPWVARRELAEGSLVTLPLGRRKLKRTIGILQWRGRRLTLAEETFIGLCKTVTEGLA
ncbi:MAG: LysR family transcriptional regulator [Chthoniobacteraceae bacterium]